MGSSQKGKAMNIRLQTAITFVAALWLLMLLVGCEADPVSRVQSSNNKNITVDSLFEHEGCRVYRFDDGDMRRWIDKMAFQFTPAADRYPIYYANCGAFAQTSSDPLVRQKLHCTRNRFNFRLWKKQALKKENEPDE